MDAQRQRALPAVFPPGASLAFPSTLLQSQVTILTRIVRLDSRPPDVFPHAAAGAIYSADASGGARTPAEATARVSGHVHRFVEREAVFRARLESLAGTCGSVRFIRALGDTGQFVLSSCGLVVYRAPAYPSIGLPQ